MDLQGEHLEATERLVVTPAAGVFEAAEDLPHQIEIGSTVGYIHSQDLVTPVRSQFAGELVSLVAASGERLILHQRVAWLRAS
jgi:hypothetical protein